VKLDEAEEEEREVDEEEDDEVLDDATAGVGFVESFFFLAAG